MAERISAPAWSWSLTMPIFSAFSQSTYQALRAPKTFARFIVEDGPKTNAVTEALRRKAFVSADCR
ncbi:hypothetical protein [Mycobacterium sp. M23085]|uniref:hypothetical protein n=1 Tax=Mycobacterium sp. M23085 TaxID=3378087 RepID=UPI003877BA77